MHQQINLIRLIVPVVVCFALAPIAQAIGPDTDGSIAGSNNGEGLGVLVSRTTGVWNTGTGYQALNHLTSGNQNTATGLRALFSNSTGFNNTATGVYSLFGNTSGFLNSATGAYSLAHNTTGSSNTANGYGALFLNNEGEQNTATGRDALYHNTTGFGNTANGIVALYRNITGGVNTANGGQALLSNTAGSGNTANGYNALGNNITGSNNTASGVQALFLSNGSGNIALGAYAGGKITTANNVICIGADGDNVDNSCFIGQIFGATSSGGTAVFINSDGKLGTATSSRRFKEEIQPMEQASEALFALKPVTFRYKKGIDPQRIPQFGLVAEDVEAASPDLVVRDKEGKVNTVRYEAVNAMLLNEFLKEHSKVERLEAKLAEQEKKIEALTSGLQRVSAQVEMSKPAPKTVLNQ
jgi:hypothetical protein